MVVILAGPGMGFPNGVDASTYRVLLYARGLVDQGRRVLVLCLGPSETPAVGVMNLSIRGFMKVLSLNIQVGRPFEVRNRVYQAVLVLEKDSFLLLNVWLS